MLPSLHDISYQRSSRALYKDLSTIFRDNRTNTMESLEVIIETNEDGLVIGLRVSDFGDADIKELARLNDLALETI
jgi:hypothetical protein